MFGHNFSFQKPPSLPLEFNVFFIILSFALSILGCFTALQFTEQLVMSRLQINNLQKGNTILTLFAACFTIGVNAVWLMHFINTSSASVNGYPMRFSLSEVVLSLIYILLATIIGYVLFCTHSSGLISMDPVEQQMSPFIKLYYSRPADNDSWVAHIKHLLQQARAVLGWRIITAGAIIGGGVYAMHHSGVHATRAKLKIIYDPIWILSSIPVGIVAGTALLFVLFTMHGWKRRIPASIILGVAVQAVHWHGYFSATFTALEPHEWDPYAWVGTVLVDAKVATVVVLLVSSVVRFTLMGVISVSSD